MNLLTRFLSWLKWMVKGQRLESEMETEVHFHLQSYAADLVRKGLSQQEAMRQATKMPCGHPWACAGGVN